MNLKTPTRGREVWNGKGIVAFVGANGYGKTAAMVWATMPTLEAGLPVLSTVRLTDYLDPRPCEDPECHIVTYQGIRWQWAKEPCDKTDPSRHRQAHPLWVPFLEWPQLMEWEFGDILMDEVSGVASSRDHHAMPSEVGNHLQQLRKGDCVTRWTAPSWSRADTIIRGCTQLVVSTRGFMPVSHKPEPGKIARRWKQNRLFVYRAFDAYAFEDFTASTRDRLKPVNTSHHWGPGSKTFDAYSTYEKSLYIGSVSLQGRCMICGGTRRAPACKGHNGEHLSLAEVASARAPLAGAHGGPATPQGPDGGEIAA